MSVYPVSDAFRMAYVDSHVVSGAAVLLDQTGSELATLALDIAGLNDVTVDVTAANRRRCSCAIIDDGTLLPISAEGVVSPVSNEIALARGIRYTDDTEELVPLGVFGIQTAQQAMSPVGPVLLVTAIDRSKRLDVDLSYALSFPAGTLFSDVITTLADASGVIFSKNYDAIVTSTVSPKLVFAAGTNIWQSIQNAAASLGCWAYFDVNGVLTVVPVPLPDETSVEWEYEAGAQAVFDSTVRTVEIEDGSRKAYSHAVVQTNSTNGVPLRADAYDTDPGSPTYWLGPFGDRPIFGDDLSGYVTTLGQAQDAADALLRRNYGLLEKVTFRAAPNPALGGGDIVSITDPKTGTDGVYVSEVFNMPVFAAGGTMSVTFRVRQLVGG